MIIAVVPYRLVYLVVKIPVQFARYARLFSRFVQYIVTRYRAVVLKMQRKLFPQLYRKIFKVFVRIELHVADACDDLPAVVLTVLRAVRAVQIEYGVYAVFRGGIHELFDCGKVVIFTRLVHIGYRGEIDVHIGERQPYHVNSHIRADAEILFRPPVFAVGLP